MDLTVSVVTVSVVTQALQIQLSIINVLIFIFKMGFPPLMSGP